MSKRRIIPRKADQNQASIVRSVRAHGIAVIHLHTLGSGIPDTLMAGPVPCPHCGQTFTQNILVEIKYSDGKLTPDEKQFIEKWPGMAVVVRDEEEALALFGVLGKTPPAPDSPIATSPSIQAAIKTIEVTRALARKLKKG